jgi:glycosyltransferase involved in cell wall biosynthesis
MPQEPHTLVSVIMPTYNRAAFILESIKSIQKQTYANWELLIMDDGSEDNTADIIKKLNDNRIFYNKMERSGQVGKLKNMAIQKARGHLIAFLDSDDLWAAEKLARQVSLLQKYPAAGFCLTNGYNFEKKGEPIDHFYQQKTGLRVDSLFNSYFNSEVAAFTQALMVRKEVAVGTGGFTEGGTFGDAQFIISLCSRFIGIISYEPLVYRRIHKSNYIHANWIKSYHEGIALIRSNKKNLPGMIASNALYRLYINFGEKHLAFRERKKAILRFLDAWKQKPLSIVPMKKIGKALLRSI